MTDIQTALESFQTGLSALAIPLGIIGMVCFIMAFLVKPMLGDILGNNQGWVQRALFALAALGFIPAIVRGLVGLGGGG